MINDNIFLKSISYNIMHTERLGDPDAGLENYFWPTDICLILYIAAGIRVTISQAKSIVLPQNFSNADSSVKRTVNIDKAQQYICALQTTVTFIPHHYYVNKV